MNTDSKPAQVSHDPDTARRELAIAVARHVEVAEGALAAARAALAALDDVPDRRPDRPTVAPRLLTVREVSQALRFCPTKINALIQSGELGSVRIGTSRRVPVEALEDYLTRLGVAS